MRAAAPLQAEPPREMSSQYSHDIFSETNRKILKNHELSGLNEEELCVLLLQNDPFLLPDVCGAYNKGGGFCTLNDSCSRLHICRYFLRGECRFLHCKRSHNLLDPVATILLISEGLDQDTIWNIQTICDARIADFIKDLRTPNCAAAAERKYPNARPKNERPTVMLNTNNFVKVDQPDQGVKTAPRSPSAEKEKSDDICLHYVWQFCKNKNNCSMIHYDLPYRWQIFTSNGWKDLPRREEIEKAYCDPNITSFPDLELDFVTMTSIIVPIRRLSTVSSVTKEPKFVMTTKWLWYWKNDLGQWIEYGKQRNVNYSTQREVRRRPKFVSSEDVKTKKGHAAAAAATAATATATARTTTTTPTPTASPVSAPTYPPKWDNAALPAIGYAAIELNRGSPEFLKIENLFQLTMKSYKIHKIERIQNPSLWQVYHYFARDASYSDNYSQAKEDEKAMFLAQVLVGEFAVGRQVYTRPPAKLADVLNSYDSCVDNTINPSIFVIFEKHQAYPAYLIFYREEKKCVLS
ncbi:Zinc finger CCCH-type antiviral protein 1 [Ophiophagus hannah]|uniref:Zinc finger CCCH-type antiviral protein 1 n=1 Tax=Ophiophagus hannah TaxID=8665 RepID=V8NCI9_OPHHA|nr:Zinc finger CCCH-type antiviral protein 1 [Ophiophagus hannah]